MKKHKNAKPTLKPIHVTDANKGHHRIELGGVAGPWYPWIGIAELKLGSISYRAATSYYEGTLPVGEVFTIKVVS